VYVLGTYQYILEGKSMYSVLVHASGKKYVQALLQGTYWFMSVYIGTILKHGLYWYHTKAYWYTPV
jgi:hypothetical protein